MPKLKAQSVPKLIELQKLKDFADTHNISEKYVRGLISEGVFKLGDDYVDIGKGSVPRYRILPSARKTLYNHLGIKTN